MMHSDKVTTTASESRKSSKPIMEKRRRARINASLSELKSLLLEVIKKEGARHSKMEKADILEMTVKHLRQLQRQQFTANPTDPTVLNKYRLGFNECATEVSRFLVSLDGCDAELRARLLNHLSNCMVGVSPNNTPTTTTSTPAATCATPPPSPSVAVRPLHIQTSLPVQCATTTTTTTTANIAPATPNFFTPQSPAEINNNIPIVAGMSQPIQMAKLFSGLQVIPTKLPSGEIAFVLPANVLGGGQVPNYVIPIYTPPSFPATMPSSSIGTAAVAPGMMTLTPTANALQSCTLSSFPGNLNLVSYPSSSPGSAFSTSASSSGLVSPVQNSADSTVNVPVASISSISSSKLMSESREIPRENVTEQNAPSAQRPEIVPLVIDENVWRPW